jgi:hypothetical protein
MKKGDLCTNRYDDIFICLGKGAWRGWMLVYEIATGRKAQWKRTDLVPLKKNKKNTNNGEQTWLT